jgi:hypothetical protein
MESADRNKKNRPMQTYLEPTQESGRARFMRGVPGEVVMLNAHTLPYLTESGGALLFLGEG